MASGDGVGPGDAEGHNGDGLQCACSEAGRMVMGGRWEGEAWEARWPRVPRR